jgi:hypothetical protein
VQNIVTVPEDKQDHCDAVLAACLTTIQVTDHITAHCCITANGELVGMKKEAVIT